MWGRIWDILGKNRRVGARLSEIRAPVAQREPATGRAGPDGWLGEDQKRLLLSLPQRGARSATYFTGQLAAALPAALRDGYRTPSDSSSRLPSGPRTTHRSGLGT